MVLDHGPATNIDLQKLDHAIVTVQRFKIGKDVTSDWPLCLADALAGASTSDYVRDVLVDHGWSGSRFRSSPNRKQLLADLVAAKMEAVQVVTSSDVHSDAHVSVERAFAQCYTLGKKIGCGGFAQVYVATEVTSGQELAVKIVRRPAVRDIAGGHDKADRCDEDVTAEISAWRQVGMHDNVVCLHDSFLEHRGWHMVMEKCTRSFVDMWEGSTIRLHFNDVGGHAHARRIFREMLCGIRHVHQACIIHLDIKLDNFLLGGVDGETVKLADFGMSIQLPRKSLGLRQGAMWHGVFGTPAYMSPEMIQERGFDQKTDMWSFAVTAFKMVHHKFPYGPTRFGQDSSDAIKQAIRNDSPKLVFRDRDRDDALKCFVESLCQREPRNRCTASEALLLPFLRSSEARKNSKSSVSTSASSRSPSPCVLSVDGGSDKLVHKCVRSVDGTEPLRNADEVSDWSWVWWACADNDAAGVEPCLPKLYRPGESHI